MYNHDGIHKAHGKHPSSNQTLKIVKKAKPAKKLRGK